MTVVLEGELIVRRHDDGRVEVVQAPQTARISLGLLASADPVTLRVTGCDRITVGGWLAYRIVGWDRHGRCLLAEREDRREVPDGV